MEFIQRNEIPYPVGLDNDDIAWNTWGSFLIILA